jgi:hypothetical protein
MTIIYEETGEEGGEEGGAEIPQQRVTIRVNGRKVIAEVEPRLLLAHLLRHGSCCWPTSSGTAWG